MKTKVGVDLDGVLRDTFLKISQVYEKNYLENFSDEFSEPIKTYTLDESGNTELNELTEEFRYEMTYPINNLDLKEHFKFPTEDDFYNFLYEDFVMQIFGHAPSTEMDTYDVVITSNPELIKLYPEKCVKFKTSYNKDVIANCETDTIKNLIKKIEDIKYVDLI